MSSARSDEAKPKLSSDEKLAALLTTLQAEVIGLKTRFTESETRNEALEETIVNLTHENELLKRRIYGNKTERTGTSELQLTLGALLDSENSCKKSWMPRSQRPVATTMPQPSPPVCREPSPRDGESFRPAIFRAA